MMPSSVSTLYTEMREDPLPGQAATGAVQQHGYTVVADLPRATRSEQLLPPDPHVLGVRTCAFVRVPSFPVTDGNLGFVVDDSLCTISTSCRRAPFPRHAQPCGRASRVYGRIDAGYAMLDRSRGVRTMRSYLLEVLHGDVRWAIPAQYDTPPHPWLILHHRRVFSTTPPTDRPCPPRAGSQFGDGPDPTEPERTTTSTVRSSSTIGQRLCLAVAVVARSTGRLTAGLLSRSAIAARSRSRLAAQHAGVTDPKLCARGRLLSADLVCPLNVSCRLDKTPGVATSTSPCTPVGSSRGRDRAPRRRRSSRAARSLGSDHSADQVDSPRCPTRHRSARLKPSLYCCADVVDGYPVLSPLVAPRTCYERRHPGDVDWLDRCSAIRSANPPRSARDAYRRRIHF